MKESPKNYKRRDFFKKCGLSTVPFLLPSFTLNSMSFVEEEFTSVEASQKLVNFIYDGLWLSPRQYLMKLTEIDQKDKLQADIYGNGGPTRRLEERFAEITGKEKAIYLPTGTMANQLAMKLLNGSKTKVIVPDNSHIFRDEADAAQSVHGLRLVPIGKDKAFFELEDLRQEIEYITKNEVFKSGLGTIVIENPIRRASGTIVPIETIKEISAYCKSEGYKMHLDGARIHMASAFANISIKEYSSYFDTVYISLYKCLNSHGGAVLCGDAEIIDQLAHEIKILGGTMFQNWNNTAIAMHYQEGISQRLKQMVINTKILIEAINREDGINITSWENGSNIFKLKLGEGIIAKDLGEKLYKEHDIWVRGDGQGGMRFSVNESLLNRDLEELIEAWKTALKEVRK